MRGADGQTAPQYDPTVPLARMMLANVWEQAELAKEEGTPDPAVLARAAHAEYPAAERAFSPGQHVRHTANRREAGGI